MKLGALPTLQAVLRRGSFVLAAEELGLTPSAVSQQMRQLEQYFGQPLFDRSGRSVKPTPLAFEVVGTVQGAIAGLEALRDRSQRDLHGRLRFGATNTVQLSVLPQALRRVMERHPGIDLHLEPEHISENLLEMVKAGHIDAAVVTKTDAGTPRGLLCEAVADEPFVLVHPRRHAPAGSGAAAVRELAGALPWIRYNARLAGGKMAARYLRQLAPGLEARFEVMSSDAVLNMVSEGLGFSVIPLPRQALQRQHPVGLVRLDRQMPKRHIVLARRAVDIDNRRIHALLECLRDAYAQAEAG